MQQAPKCPCRTMRKLKATLALDSGKLGAGSHGVAGGPVKERHLEIGVEPPLVVKASKVPDGAIDECHQSRAPWVHDAEE